MRKRTPSVAAIAAAVCLMMLLVAPTPAPVAANPQSTHILITEVQSRAPNVSSNIANAVELYNPTANAISIASWAVNFYDASNQVTATAGFPMGTSIPAFGFLVVKDPGFTPAPLQPSVQTVDYTLAGAATDGLADNGGVAVFDHVGQVDGVATTAGATTPLEGSPAAPLSTSTDHRNACNQRAAGGVDTGDNAADFLRLACGFGSTG